LGTNHVGVVFAAAFNARRYIAFTALQDRIPSVAATLLEAVPCPSGKRDGEQENQNEEARIKANSEPEAR
jgi:hypothetical protein